MGKQKDNIFQDYVRRLKKAGIYDPRLDPQIRQAANTEKLINDLTAEQDKIPTAYYEADTKGQPRLVASPLLAHIAKYQSILINQLRAIGLNYDATPAKINEAPNPKNDAGGGIAAASQTRQFNFTPPRSCGE